MDIDTDTAHIFHALAVMHGWSSHPTARDGRCYRSPRFPDGSSITVKEDRDGMATAAWLEI